MAAVSDPAILGEISLFEELSPEQLSCLNDLMQSRTFPPGSLVMGREQPGDAAYVVRTGSVKIQVEGDNQAPVILAILGPGEVVGEMSVVDRLGRSATVVTQEESVLLEINRNEFWECMRNIPALPYNLCRVLSRRVRLADEQIRSLATLDVYGRVSRQILAFAREYGQHGENGEIQIPFRLTQHDLASLVGASRVRVNQVLVYYRRKKYISTDDHHHISIHDSASLARRCV